MSLISVQIKRSQQRRLMKTMNAWPRKAKTVERRAINQVAKREQGLIVRTARALVNVRAKFLKKGNVKLSAAKGNRLVARIQITGGRIPLVEFSARATKKQGVTYQITKNDPRQRIPNAFIRTMKSGHTGVYTRKGAARLPIQELRGPSIPVILQNDQRFRKETQEQRVVTDLARELEIQADLVISQAK